MNQSLFFVGLGLLGAGLAFHWFWPLVIGVGLLFAAFGLPFLGALFGLGRHR